jgi:hypothetical protein
MNDETTVVQAELPGGGTLAIRAVDLGGAQDVAGGDSLRFEDVADTVRQIAASIGQALKEAAPDKASVAFGLEIAVKSGKLVSLLADASGKATLSVTLEWSG